MATMRNSKGKPWEEEKNSDLGRGVVSRDFNGQSVDQN